MSLVLVQTLTRLSTCVGLALEALDSRVARASSDTDQTLHVCGTRSGGSFVQLVVDSKPVRSCRREHTSAPRVS